MKPISTTYKNFLACGNNPITINFTEHHLNLVVGNNGAGKSMFLDAITFALYGKSFREVNKAEMINNDNGSDCLVEFIFELKGDEYKIYRGIKPNIFQIFKNGVKIEEESAASQQQAYLQDLIGIKYDAFKQIVVLGASNYIPFMKLKPSERRKFIEDILDMQVFSKMSEITRTEYKLLMEHYRTNGEEIRLLENELTIRMETLRNYTSKKDNDLKKFDDGITQMLEELQKKRAELLKFDHETLKENLSIIQLQLKSLDKVLNSLETTNSIDQKMSDFLEHNDNCPTCEQEISKDFKADKVGKLSSDITGRKIKHEKTSLYRKMSYEKGASVEGEINRYTALRNEVERGMEQLRNTQSQKESFVSGMGNDDEIEREKSRIEELNGKLKTLRVTREGYDIDVQDYTKIISFLNDDGLKSEVVKKYIPIVNEKVNDYLMKMNFTGDFTLDESFNETIKARKRDKFSYKNFSEGERKRIDLALMFTWRDITNMVNQTNKINLLVLDEIFDSSLDGNGVEDFIDIIRDMEGQNIFIISHRSDNMLEHFDNVIAFEKVDGFSQMVVD